MSFYVAELNINIENLMIIHMIIKCWSKLDRCKCKTKKDYVVKKNLSCLITVCVLFIKNLYQKINMI